MATVHEPQTSAGWTSYVAAAAAKSMPRVSVQKMSFAASQLVTDRRPQGVNQTSVPAVPKGA